MAIDDFFLRTGLFLLFLLGGALVFLFGSSYHNLFPTNRSPVFRAGLPAAFLALTVFLASRGLTAAWQAAFAFFAAAGANLLATLGGPRLGRLVRANDQSIRGMALAKFSEALLNAGCIIGLCLLARVDLGSVYLRAGNLPVGLAVGLTTLALFAGAAYRQLRSFQLAAKTITAYLPWMALFALSNAFMEELWFRGIFLQKLEPFLGGAAALFLTSIVFTGAHIGAAYLSTAERLRFLAILFPLALAWGFLMQFTGSLAGSTLFHAGADLLILNGYIAAFEGKTRMRLG
jgi:membrane protease YdiL (CAAX protease family)